MLQYRTSTLFWDTVTTPGGLLEDQKNVPIYIRAGTGEYESEFTHRECWTRRPKRIGEATITHSQVP